MVDSLFIHPTAIVENEVSIGAGTKIWHYAHLRRGAVVGRECVIAKGVYIDAGVRVGSRVKIQNNASLYQGVEILDGVFIGPHVCFTNDKFPRAVNPDLSLKSSSDWVVSTTRVDVGASLGANTTIIAGITIGTWSLVAAGSVVTKNVPPYALVQGNPARICGIVSPDGKILSRQYRPGSYSIPGASIVVEVLDEWCR
jgi:acetyltransferase-like isoleucine patch superfamily enzyme